MQYIVLKNKWCMVSIFDVYSLVAQTAVQNILIKAVFRSSMTMYIIQPPITNSQSDLNVL